MTIEQVQIVTYPRIAAVDGQLSIFETGANIPYPMKRVFTVLANAGELRGQHAHKACSQILVCLSGEIIVHCDDGLGGTCSHALRRDTQALLVPPGIWASEEYRIDNSVLLVLCDQGYDPDDYIRNYATFLAAVKGT